MDETPSLSRHHLSGIMQVPESSNAAHYALDVGVVKSNNYILF